MRIVETTLEFPSGKRQEFPLPVKFWAEEADISGKSSYSL